MIYPVNCLKKYGLPVADNQFLTMWDVPTELEIGVIPKKIYCNTDLIKPLSKVFEMLIFTGFIQDLKTWDGCFNIRMQRGSDSQYSLHSWAIAVDVNAAWNQFGKPPTLSADFVDIWKQCGFDWGGDFGQRRIDGMHFQLSKI
jgi:hypothetical protein